KAAARLPLARRPHGDLSRVRPAPAEREAGGARILASSAAPFVNGVRPAGSDPGARFRRTGIVNLGSSCMWTEDDNGCALCFHAPAAEVRRAVPGPRPQKGGGVPWSGGAGGMANKPVRAPAPWGRTRGPAPPPRPPSPIGDVGRGGSAPARNEGSLGTPP